MGSTNKQIKVLQVCAVGFTVAKLLRPLIDEMGKYYDVTTVCSRDSISDELRQQGYNIENITIDRKISPIRNIKTVLRLYKFIKKEKFQIVHVHTPVAGILGRIAAKLAGVPVVVYTAHGFYFHDQMPSVKKMVFVFMEKVGGFFSDFIFTQSREDYETGIKARIIDRSKILAIGNGIDITRFDKKSMENNPDAGIIKEEFGILPSDKVIGIIGRVVEEKGYLEWVKAAKQVISKHKNVKFLAVGETLSSDRDGVKAELDQYIRENRLENHIVFAGSRNDIPELLSIMDVFTLPSYREGMPRSLIEAMSMSKPVVATDIRGCREEVINEVTGFLIPVKDEETLAEKITYLLEHPDICAAMGQSARKRVEEEFDEKVVIQRQLDVFGKLISQKLRG